ncbi:MAG TPA: malto-oligosyltrehalose trehalohydrolase, partial [Gammaproteobacteria bacterium]|nr:malto-oligosyltrehalose trehalohydrolase [Gammaproteobacteria bacterium]
MPYGAELRPDGVRFRLWAPAVARVQLHIEGRPALSMQRQDDGFLECLAEGAKAGDRYTYSFDDEPLHVPDPASRFNPAGLRGPSEVIAPDTYEWKDGRWAGRPWGEAVLYELHVGSFTAEGTYAGAAKRLDYLAELGVTAVELMPLAQTPGRRNWGYDGVLPFAPAYGYGRPEELKRLIDAAHRRRLMVFLDVVYNHFGPEGNYLHLYAPQFFTDRHRTPWGSAVNFDGPDSGPVRRFFIDNALYWLEEYHFDGLRLDAVHAIIDDSEPSFLEELAAAVARRFVRERHLVLENVRNEAHYLRRDGAHYAAQWNDDFHHAVHVLLTGESGGYYQDYECPCERLLRCLTEGFAYQGEASKFDAGNSRGEPSADLPAEAFVNFLQNHDQIGNRAFGERLSMLASSELTYAAEMLLLLLPTPILLFMGEEFHAPNPFPYFCDYAGELGQAVTDGRRREFADFFSTADLEAIPDPNAPATAESAKLDWGALAAPDCRRAITRYRHLLALRRNLITPRLPSAALGGRMLASSALTASWRLADGSTLAVAANLGSSPVALAAWP